jgi:hypothetical protein
MVRGRRAWGEMIAAELRSHDPRTIGPLVRYVGHGGPTLCAGAGYESYANDTPASHCPLLPARTLTT